VRVRKVTDILGLPEHEFSGDEDDGDRDGITDDAGGGGDVDWGVRATGLRNGYRLD